MSILNENLEQSMTRFNGFVPEGARFEQGAFDAYEETENLRVETKERVKSFAKYILSELAGVWTLPVEPAERYIGHDAESKRFTLNAKTYALYIGRNSAASEENLEFPIRVGQGMRRKDPLPSLLKYDREAWPIGISVERRENRLQRHTKNDGLFGKDIVARLDYPHDVTSESLKPENFGRSVFRYAVSNTGHLNGLWRTSQHLDDKMDEKGVRRHEFLDYQGHLDRYARINVEALGNACVLAESIDVLFGGENRPSAHINIDVHPHIASFTQVADAWLAKSTHKDYRQGHPLTLFASEPIGLGYDEAMYQIGLRIPSIPVPAVQ